MNIGKKIHDRRIALGLTLEQVGEACGVGKATVQRWESGAIQNMRRDKLAQLARVLQMHIEDLVEESGMVLSTEDLDRLEALHQNPRLGLLFDRQRDMAAEDIEFMMQMADRILKERDNE